MRVPWGSHMHDPGEYSWKLHAGVSHSHISVISPPRDIQKQLLVPADLPMIALGGFLQELLVLGHLLLIWERHSVNPIQSLVQERGESIIVRL